MAPHNPSTLIGLIGLKVSRLASRRQCAELFQRMMPPAEMDVPEPGEQPVDLCDGPGHDAPVAEVRWGHDQRLLGAGA